MKKFIILALSAVLPIISSASNPFPDEKLQELTAHVAIMLTEGFNGIGREKGEHLKLSDYKMESITFPESINECRLDLHMENYDTFLYAVEFGDNDLHMYARLLTSDDDRNAVLINWCVSMRGFSLRMDTRAKARMVSVDSDSRPSKPMPSSLEEFFLNK